MNHSLILCVLLYATSAFSHTYGPYKVGNPYMIGNKEYTPAETISLVQDGVASWYGKELEGKATANGAIFNPDIHTAAHRTLPMPSVVLVTNLTNNKQVAVVVNDRGPFSSDTTRIIDVSKKVADDLGFTDVGRANVRLEYIPDLSRKLQNNEDFNITEYNDALSKKSQNDKPRSIAIVENSIDIDQNVAVASNIGKTTFTKDYIKAFYIQVGVFEVLANAQKIYQQLANVPKIQLRSESHNIKNYYIIRSGPFASIADAEQSKLAIHKKCNTCQAMVVII